jgi:hypothetical protein
VRGSTRGCSYKFSLRYLLRTFVALTLFASSPPLIFAGSALVSVGSIGAVPSFSLPALVLATAFLLPEPGQEWSAGGCKQSMPPPSRPVHLISSPELPWLSHGPTSRFALRFLLLNLEPREPPPAAMNAARQGSRGGGGTSMLWLVG